MNEAELKSFRRTLKNPGSPAVIQALRRILRGIYYRHEFARRNPDVLIHSKELLPHFFPTPERAKTFQCPERGDFLTDDLMGIYGRAEPTKQEDLKSRLRGFLMQWKVLPMAESPTPFFTVCNSQNAWDMWKALLRFELFALTEIQVGRPVMFPVMYVGGFTPKGGNQVQIGGLLDWSREPYPMSMRFELPDDIISDYLTAYEALVYVGFPSLRKAIGNKRKADVLFRRVHDDDEDFDVLLKAHDLKKFPPPRGKMFGEMKKLHCRKQPDRPHDPVTVLRAFRGWRRKAQEYIIHYDVII